MRFLLLIRKEFNFFFHSLSGYLSIIVFLGVNSFFLWIYPNSVFNIFENRIASLEGLFQLSPWVSMFLASTITMKSFADEKAKGTMSLLFSLPIKYHEIVLSKFFGCLFVLLFSYIPTILYYYSIDELAYPVGNVDFSAIVGSYLGLILLSVFFTSIGIFISSLSENVIISFLVSILTCFFLFMGFSLFYSINDGIGLAGYIQKIGGEYHYEALRRGVINMSDVFYFLSVSSFFLFVTIEVIHIKKRKA